MVCALFRRPRRATPGFGLLVDGSIRALSQEGGNGISPMDHLIRLGISLSASYPMRETHTHHGTTSLLSVLVICQAILVSRFFPHTGLPESGIITHLVPPPPGFLVG